MTTYTWKVAQLERETSDGYVFTIHWTVNATETIEDQTYSAGAYGSIGLERPKEDLIPFEDLTEELVVSSIGLERPKEDLIPFEDLTEELVVSWIQEKLDVETYETSLQSQLDEQKAPSKLSGVPWQL